MRRDLSYAGLFEALEKCHWDPEKFADWLGIDIDLIRFTLSIPDRRVQSAIAGIDKLLSDARVTSREVLRVTGKLISMSQILGPVAQLRTRALYNTVLSRSSWDGFVSLGPSQVSELIFWKENLKELNVFDLAWAPSAKIAVFSDASASACGAHATIDGYTHVAHKEWSELEKQESSTWRELETVRFCLSSFGPLLRNRLIQWNTDNQGVPSIILKGSSRDNLQAIAMDIFRISVRFNLSLEPVWLPRSLNSFADSISRVQDFDNWSVRREIFDYIDSAFGPHTCDCFADSNNPLLPKFYSRFYQPGCSAVNAFAQDWSQVVNWLVPPVALVGPAIIHLLRSKSKGTLLTPWWPSASFWPLLFPEGNSIPQVQQLVKLPKHSAVFRPGTHQKSVFAAERFQSPVLVVFLDAT